MTIMKSVYQQDVDSTGRSATQGSRAADKPALGKVSLASRLATKGTQESKSKRRKTAIDARSRASSGHGGAPEEEGDAANMEQWMDVAMRPDKYAAPATVGVEEGVMPYRGDRTDSTREQPAGHGDEAGGMSGNLVGGTDAFTDPATGAIHIAPSLPPAQRAGAAVYERANRDQRQAYMEVHEAVWRGDIETAEEFGARMAALETNAARAETRYHGDTASAPTPDMLDIGDNSAASHYAQLFAEVQGGSVVAVSRAFKKDPILEWVNRGRALVRQEPLPGPAATKKHEPRTGNKKKKQRRTSANRYLIELSASQDVRAEVVARLDEHDTFRKLLWLVGVNAVWTSEPLTEALIALFPLRVPDKAREDIIHLLRQHWGKLDLGVDRHDARLAFELVKALPDADQALILGWSEDSKKTLKDEVAATPKKDREAANKRADQVSDIARLYGKNRTETNLSREYRASGRYDTYRGDQHGTGTDKYQEKSHLVDSDRQTLVAHVLDEAEWQAGDSGRLRARLRLLIQADEQAAVKHLVVKYWSQHEPMLVKLGFRQDGSFNDYIADQTATRIIGRWIAGVRPVLSVISGLIGTKDRFVVDLEQVTKMAEGHTGVWLTKHPGVAPTTPLEVYESVISTLEISEIIISCLNGWGVDFGEFYDSFMNISDPALKRAEFIAKTGAAADLVKTVVRLRKGEDDKVAESLSCPEGVDGDPAHHNKLIIAHDPLTGELAMTVPNVTIGGMARRSGEVMYKLGGATIVGGYVEAKTRSALNTDKHFEISVKSVLLHDLTITRPESMATINTIAIDDLSLLVQAPEQKPATWLEILGARAQHVALDTLQSLPLSNLGAPGLVGVGVKAAAVVERGMAVRHAYQDVKALTGGEFKQLSMSFGGLRVEGFATSGGDYIDQISVGATELEVEQEVVGAIDPSPENINRSEAKSQKKNLRAIEKRQRRLRKRLTSRDLDDEKRAEYERELRALDQRKVAIQEALKPEALATKRTDDVAAELDEERARLNKLQARGLSRRAKRVEERVAVLERKLKQAQGMAELITALAPLQAEKDTKEAELETLRKSAEPQNKAHKSAITTLERELALLQARMLLMRAQRLRGKGTIGAVDIKGAELQGTSVQSAHIDALTVGKEKPAKEPGTSKPSGKPGFVIRGVAQRSGRRRDLVIREQLDAIERESQESKKPPNAEQAARKATLQAELELLRPLVAEYLLLRDRISDLSLDEGRRLTELRAQLEERSSLTVDKVEGKGLSMAGGDSATGSGLHAEQISVTGIGVHETSLLSRSGDTQVKQITVDDFGVGYKPGQKGTLGATGDITVTGVRSSGRDSRVKSQLGDLDQLLRSTRAEQARLTAKSPQSKDDRARLATLGEQVEALDSRRADIATGHEGARARLKEFIASTRERLPTLTVASIDYSRGMSHKAALAMQADAKRERALLVHGDAALATPVNRQVCQDTAHALLLTYDQGVVQLKKQIEQDTEAIEAERTQASVNGKFGDSTRVQDSQIKLLQTRLSQREGHLTSALAQQTLWQDRARWVATALRRHDVRAQEIAALVDRYAAIVKGAGQSGLDVSNPDELSAQVLIDAADAQINGFSDLTVGAVRATGVNMEVTGVAAVADRFVKGKDPASGLEVRGGGPDQQMVQSVTVTDIEQGKAHVGDIAMHKLGGNVIVHSARHFEVGNLSIGDVELSQIAWHASTLAVVSERGVKLRGVSVNADIKLGEDATSPASMVVTSLKIASMTAPDFALTYEDMQFSLGARKSATKDGDKTKDKTKDKPPVSSLTDIRASGLDLAAGTFASVDIGTLSTAGLAADLGAGMSVGARTVSAKNLHIAQIKDMYQLAVGEMNASDMDVKMASMGVDFHVDAVRKAKLKHFQIDLASGEYQFDGIVVPRLMLGPVAYAGDGMDVRLSRGIDLSDVTLRGRGGDGHLTLESMTARSAAFASIDYKAKGPDGTQDIHMDGGSMKMLAIEGFDVMAGTMTLSATQTHAAGLQAHLVSSLGSTELSGTYDIARLGFSSVSDKSGERMAITFSDANATGGSMTSTSVSQGLVRDKNRDPTGQFYQSTDLTNVDISEARGASGTITTGQKRGKSNSTMGFRDVSVKALTLPTMLWSAGDTVITGNGVNISTITASGRTETREEMVAGMPLPVTDIHLDHVTIADVTADKLRYTTGGNTQEIDAKKTRIKGIEIQDLEQIGGQMVGGSIALKSAATDLRMVQSAANGAFSEAGMGLRAQSLRISFSEDHGAYASLDSLQVNRARFTVNDESGARAHIEAPWLMLKCIHGNAFQTLQQSAKKTSVHRGLHAHVDSLQLLQDATFTYQRATPGPTKLKSEETSADRKNAALQDKKMRDMLQPVDWDAVCASLNGELSGRLRTDLFSLSKTMSASIRNGVARYTGFFMILGPTGPVPVPVIVVAHATKGSDGLPELKVQIDGLSLDFHPLSAKEDEPDNPSSASDDQILDKRQERRVTIAMLQAEVKRQEKLSAAYSEETQGGLNDAYLAQYDKLRDVHVPRHILAGHPSLGKKGQTLADKRYAFYMGLDNARNALESAKYPERDPEQYVANVWVEDIMASIDLGNCVDLIQTALGDGHKLRYRNIHMALTEEHRSADEGTVYHGSLALHDLGFYHASGTGNTDVNIGQANLRTDIAKLFPLGQILLYGSFGSERLEQSIEGSVRAGSVIKNVDVTFDYQAQRDD